MNRSQAVRIIVETFGDAFFIACNGFITRELYSMKDQAKNFYLLGSMGIPVSVGLGLSLARPDKKVVVLNGDGNLLMSLGSLATIGKTKPANLVILVLDNECYESTGAQESASSAAELHNVAKSAGFRNSLLVKSSTQLKKVINQTISAKGPTFIQVKIDEESSVVPRANIDPVYVKDRFMQELIRS